MMKTSHAMTARYAKCISIPGNSCITRSAPTIRTEALAGRVHARSRASLGEPRIESWLAGWPTSRQSGGTVTASLVPVQHPSVLRWLPSTAHAAPPFSAELCAMLYEEAGDLEWRQTYTQADVYRREQTSLIAMAGAS